MWACTCGKQWEKGNQASGHLRQMVRRYPDQKHAIGKVIGKVGEDAEPVKDKSKGDGKVKAGTPTIKSLFNFNIKGVDVDLTADELVDMVEVYRAFQQAGYNGRLFQLARASMVKMAVIADIKPTLYMEVESEQQ